MSLVSVLGSTSSPHQFRTAMGDQGDGTAPSYPVSNDFGRLNVRHSCSSKRSRDTSSSEASGDVVNEEAQRSRFESPLTLSSHPSISTLDSSGDMEMASSVMASSEQCPRLLSVDGRSTRDVHEAQVDAMALIEWTAIPSSDKQLAESNTSAADDLALPLTSPGKKTVSVHRPSDYMVGKNTGRLPRVRGAVTTLYAINQLRELLLHLPQPTHLSPFSEGTESLREECTPSDGVLQIRKGETVLLLLHRGSGNVSELFNMDTVELSTTRIFCLDLARLPPEEYCVLQEPTDTAGGGGCTTDDPSVKPLGSRGDDGDDEELFTGATPGEPLSPIKSDVPLSTQLHDAEEAVMHRLMDMLRLDASFHPTLSMTTLGGSLVGSAGAHRSNDDSVSGGAGEPVLPLPAFVVWRASGGSLDEYPPSPPQTYSSQPMPTPPTAFDTYMQECGGALAVKPVHGIHLLHAFSLFHLVYTPVHLLRTLVNMILSHADYVPGQKSRSVLFLGASWCPPCMRIVSAMPDILREDLPNNVHCFAKADMDLSKPIFDLLKVEVIPTFIVFDNDPLIECHQTLLRDSGHGTSAPLALHQSKQALVEDALRKAELGRLQQSKRPLVTMFIEKHCQSLAFDEDF